jgi:D-lactate dehydrogenase
MTLLAPPASAAPASDRAPDTLAGGTAEPLRSGLVACMGEDRVLTRAIDLVRYASDASPYRRLPQAVVLPRDTEDVRTVFAYARRHGLHVGLRGGGTSLNGQAQTDGILVDVRRWWSGVHIEDDGARVRLRCGTLLGTANRMLARHRVKLGPDPGSTNIATAGGVIANNSGGMRCGTTWDAYSTVESMTLVLASGLVVDTAAPDAEDRFAAAEPELAHGLLELRDELRADAELAARVRRKFEIKNTMGYRLCALLDADTPLEIFRRLVVGSEGTLAFVAEAVFRTRPEPAHTSVAWVHFPSIMEAVASVPALLELGARATELMIGPALTIAGSHFPGTPARWADLPRDSAALLVEFGRAEAGDLDADEAAAARVFADRPLLFEAEFTRDADAVELAWTVREGLFGLMGQLRPRGTALLVEDICVRTEQMAECARDIMALLAEHGYSPGVAGHVSAGNLHFMLTPDLSQPADVERYHAFIERLVDLVADTYDGSLKAEHGTGVNMAPYVEREWGATATEMMWRIKRLADPGNVLSPEVVLSRDPGIHLRHFQSQPAIEDVATQCVECGFCEPVCPSRNATMTPRQRIVVRREIARQPTGSPVQRALLADFDHDAVQTCAVDGSCAPACPLSIDTGALMKAFRARGRSPLQERVAVAVARRFALAERAARGVMAAAGTIGPRPVGALARALRRRFGDDLVPLPPAELPPAAGRLPRTSRAGAAAVYLPACVNRILGNPGALEAGPSLPEALVEVSARAGVPLWIPDDVAGHCCGTPWSSKGYAVGHRLMVERTAAALWRWTDGGRLPVVTDASSCAQGLINDAAGTLTVLDSVAWIHDYVLDALVIEHPLASVALHPPCAVGHLGLTGELRAIAGALADEVIVPAQTTCCGMAGDRGLLHPELPASALGDVAAELDGRVLGAHLCSNRTCEIGLQQITGRPYASFVLLLEERSRPGRLEV